MLLSSVSTFTTYSYYSYHVLLTTIMLCYSLLYYLDRKELFIVDRITAAIAILLILGSL